MTPQPQPLDHVQLAKLATEQIRDALWTLYYAGDGEHSDLAMVAIDALDWLVEHLGLHMIEVRPNV